MAEQMNFVEGMFDEAGKFASEIVSTALDALDDALLGPFRSSSNSSPSEQHTHCYPCRDADCNKR